MKLNTLVYKRPRTYQLSCLLTLLAIILKITYYKSTIEENSTQNTAIIFAGNPYLLSNAIYVPLIPILRLYRRKAHLDNGNIRRRQKNHEKLYLFYLKSECRHGAKTLLCHSLVVKP